MRNLRLKIAEIDLAHELVTGAWVGGKCYNEYVNMCEIVERYTSQVVEPVELGLFEVFYEGMTEEYLTEYWVSSSWHMFKDARAKEINND